MRVSLLIPAVALESIAVGVFVIEYALIASAIPGVMRSHTSAVASGVLSLFEKPVPPVVKMTFTCLWSASLMSSFLRSAGSSGIRTPSITLYPAPVSISPISGPLLSSRSPAAPLSESVIQAAVNGLSGSASIISTVSPAFTVPPSRTIVNTPSLGMMQSPT